MMPGSRVARRYAQALGELAREREVLDQVEQELALVVATLEENAEFRRLLEHRQIEVAEKKRLVEAALGNRLSEISRQFLHLVLEKRREAYLVAMYREFVTYANRLRNVVEVEVKTARLLGDAEVAALSERLARATGKAIRLSQTEDPSLLGGVVVRIGDLVMDGSVVTRLARLKENLKKVKLDNVG